MIDTTTAPGRSILWLTSRSAFETGTQRCAYKRYLENHAGQYNYGWSRKATSIPLTTGTYVDFGITQVLKWIVEARISSGTQVPEAPADVVRWAIGLALEKYQATVEKRGVLTLTADDPETTHRLRNLIQEQSYLIEGLIWCWVLVRLPGILDEYQILECQTEEMYVLDCDCGIGQGLGTQEDHEARGCHGIGLMSKPDFLAERKSDQILAYFEIKTTSQARREWDQSFERKIQLIIGILGAERRTGRTISHVWVEGLVKGQRKREYGADESQPKQQQTFLAYGYHRPGAPPLTVPEWEPSYEWYDSDGLPHKAARGKDGLKKVALWAVDESQFPDKPVEMSRSEWWVRLWAVHSPTTIAKCLHPIGPLPKRLDMIADCEQAFIGEERKWQAGLWELYDFTERTGKGWETPEFQKEVGRVFVRSYQCDPYGPDHSCPMLPICFRDEGWQDPVAGGQFVHRTPHHLPERQQAEARGLVPDEGWELDEDEDGD